MSGSGDQPNRQPERSLGDYIQEELRSTFKLLFKNVAVSEINPRFQASDVAYLTNIPCDSVPVSLAAQPPQVSLDPVAVLAQQAVAVQNLPLIFEVPLAEAGTCTFDPVLCHEPVFEEMSLNSARVSFQNVSLTQSRPWPIDALQTQAWQQPIAPLDKPAASGMGVDPLHTRADSLLDKLPKVRTHDNPRLYAMPIKKSAIPPHRYSAGVREKFRQALAEKAQTRPSNVQLKIVYERMNMALYSALQQDEQGNLLCMPRNELLGKNINTKAAQALLRRQAGELSGAYLVFGIRLDNKEDIRALVPTASIEALSEGEQPS